MDSVDQDVGSPTRLAARGRVRWHEGPWRSRYGAQGHFLTAVANLRPQIPEDLETGALPIFDQLPETCRQVFRHNDWSSRWTWLAHHAPLNHEALPALEQLRLWLIEWGDRSHLPDDWAKDRAINWLLEDDDDDDILDMRRHFAWHGALRPGPRFPVRPYGYWDADRGDDVSTEYVEDPSVGYAFAVKLPAWPGVHSRTAWERRVRGAFDRALKAYGDDQETRTEADGFKPAPIKLNDEHFVWLARYQVAGESCEHNARLRLADCSDAEPMIADQRREARRVSKAVSETAALVGLTRRPDPRRKG